MDVKTPLSHVVLAVCGMVTGFVLASLAVTETKAAGTANIYTGYSTTCDTWAGQNWNPHGLSVSQGHGCWHFDELAPNQWNGALDMHTGSGQGDANQNVWWVQGGIDWSNVVTVRFDVIPPGGCTGVRPVLQSGLAGAFSYLHIIPTSGLSGTSWQNWSSWPGWVQGDRFLGTTAPTQSNCAFDGPHLHQGGNVDWWTDIWRQHPSYTNCGHPLYCWSGPAFKVTW